MKDIKQLVGKLNTLLSMTNNKVTDGVFKSYVNSVKVEVQSSTLFEQKRKAEITNKLDRLTKSSDYNFRKKEIIDIIKQYHQYGK